MITISKDTANTFYKVINVIYENLYKEAIEVDYDVKYGDFYASLNELKSQMIKKEEIK